MEHDGYEIGRVRWKMEKLLNFVSGELNQSEDISFHFFFQAGYSVVSSFWGQVPR